MKPDRLAFLLLSLAVTLSAQSHPVSLVNPLAGRAQSSGTSQADPAMRGRMVEVYGRLPLAFEANQGQLDPEVNFLSRGAGYSLFLTPTETVITLRKGSRQQSSARGTRALPSQEERSAVIRMKLVGANATTALVGQDQLPGRSNYFRGNDPKKWRTNVRQYASVRYTDVYPGIDLVYYGNQQQLEYDFIVAAGADPRRIQFDVRGAKRVRRNERGDLVLMMGDAEMRWHKPVVYQEKNGTRQEIAARYAVTNKNRVGFELAKYDAGKPLYIDPLIYSTYLGGAGTDSGTAIAVDSAGNAYVAGITCSTDFPTANAPQPNYAGGNPDCGDAFVAKINPSGSALVYSTYLGGGAFDTATSIAVDSAGNAYVTGYTLSTDFPTTPGALRTTCLGCGGSNPYGINYDAFVTKLSPTGSALAYSTYFGGTTGNISNGIAVDSAGNVYLTGGTTSYDFPVTPGAYQIFCNHDQTGGQFCEFYGDAFVAKINPAGSAVVYASFLGGFVREHGQSIAADSAGNVYVTGVTTSFDFPVTPGAFKTVCENGGCPYRDAFVTKFDPTGSSVVYSTYLGGNGYDYGQSIVVDNAGNAYVTGFTTSADFPVTPGAFQTACNSCSGPNRGPSGNGDSFVAKLNPAGSALAYSTYLGGGGRQDFGNGLAVDGAGNAYVVGTTGSKFFPVTAGAFQKTCINFNTVCVFVTKLNPSGSALMYSTNLHGGTFDQGFGLAVDSAGNAYVTGSTTSTDFPTRNPLQAANRGNGDAFVTKLPMLAATKTTLTSSPNPSTQGQAVTFTATVISVLGAPPDGETVTFKKGTSVLGTGLLNGGSASFMTSTLKVGTTAVKAVYGGDSNFAVSTSTAVKQVVNPATN